MKKLISTILLSFTLLASTANAMTATYTPMEVPTYINSSFKTWEDYRCITSTGSPQYKFIRKWGWVDGEGFMRCNGERDLGITDDYYLVALGSFYGTEIGTKYRITTNTGNVFYAALGDQKDNYDTDPTNRFASNNDIVEFLVDTRCLNRTVKQMGSANPYMPLNGSISKIEKISFN